jgi:2-polyprenyl-6-methoxyphenol hydroxylase-like FAD-dependent oxidoreductase
MRNASRAVPARPAGHRAIIIGGSMSGLFTALLLRGAGWRVEVFERSGSELSARGAGIATHPELLEVLRQAGVDIDSARLGMPISGRRVFGLNGEIICELSLPQIMASWGHLYGLLQQPLPKEAYHHGHNLERVEETQTSVVAHFSEGLPVEGDLLIGADGIFSTVRSQFAPEVTPGYAGYIAWRGLIDAADLSPATQESLWDCLAFSLPDGEQMLGYPVAGSNEAMERDRCRFNFVWYRPAAKDDVLRELLTDVDGVEHSISIPPNKIRPEAIGALRQDARRLLSPQFAEIVEKTKQPFIQAIQDLETPRMVLGPRTVILGDAAFVARPHVGMGVTKAAGDAQALANALAGGKDLCVALTYFERRRVPYGAAVVRRGRALGAYMQARLLTEEERVLAKYYGRAEAIMAETAVISGMLA